MIVEITIVSVTFAEVPAGQGPGIWWRRHGEAAYTDWKWVTVHEIQARQPNPPADQPTAPWEPDWDGSADEAWCSGNAPGEREDAASLGDTAAPPGNVAGSSSGSEPTPWQRGSLGKRTRESEWESSLPEQGKRRHAVSPADAAQAMTKTVLKLRQFIAESGTTDPHEIKRRAIQLAADDLNRFTFDILTDGN